MWLRDPAASFTKDGHTWHSVNCYYWFGEWIETQDPELWYHVGRPELADYMIRDDFLTMIQLKWF